MIRRLLIGLGIVTVILAIAGMGLWFWLAGRPLSASERRGVTVFESQYSGDLIPLPSTNFEGVSTGWPVLAAHARSEYPRLRRTEKLRTPPLRHTLNILLIGLDRRPGTTRGGRTDTLVIAVFDRTSDHVGLISIPRDLYVVVPDHGAARINAAWSIAGRQRRNRLEVLERVVEDTLTIPIHHTVAVDLSIFERSVDALDGVSVDVQCPIQDNFIDTRESNGRRRLDVEAGRQHMDGATAAMFVRSRHGRSDWDRARRQQMVLHAMRDRLMSAGGLSRLPALWDQLGAAVTTDMSRLELFRLVGRAAQANPAHLHGLVLGHRQTDAWITPEGRWVLLPQFDEIDRAMGSLFSAPAPGTRSRHATCPAADVAINRPNRRSLLRRARAMQRRARASQEAGADHSGAPPSSSPTDSNSSHSSSPSP